MRKFVVFCLPVIVLLSNANAVHAQSSRDALILKTGDTVLGTIVSNAKGKPVKIVSASGDTQTFARSKIKKVTTVMLPAQSSTEAPKVVASDSSTQQSNREPSPAAIQSSITGDPEAQFENVISAGIDGAMLFGYGSTSYPGPGVIGQYARKLPDGLPTPFQNMFLVGNVGFNYWPGKALGGGTSETVTAFSLAAGARYSLGSQFWARALLTFQFFTVDFNFPSTSVFGGDLITNYSVGGIIPGIEYHFGAIGEFLPELVAELQILSSGMTNVQLAFVIGEGF